MPPTQQTPGEAVDPARVRAFRLFRDIPDHELADVLAGCTVQPIDKDDPVCRQGDNADFLHIVLAGRIGLFTNGSRPGTLVDFVGPGDALVLPAVVLDVPYTVSARAIEKGTVMLWPVADFRRALRAHPALAHGVSALLSEHWHAFVEQIKCLKMLSVRERLSVFLTSLSPSPSGRATLTLPASRGMVAARLGVSAQSLSRAFAALRTVGVNGSGRRVTVTDVANLRRISAMFEHRRD